MRLSGSHPPNESRRPARASQDIDSVVNDVESPLHEAGNVAASWAGLSYVADEQLGRAVYRDTARDEIESAIGTVSVDGHTADLIWTTYRRVDGIREVEGDDRGALFAKVPQGWWLLEVREV